VQGYAADAGYVPDGTSVFCSQICTDFFEVDFREEDCFDKACSMVDDVPGGTWVMAHRLHRYPQMNTWFNESPLSESSKIIRRGFNPLDGCIQLRIRAFTNC
jgi:hypothetical protein